ncbi:precorrin-2 dehydrogenase/sirohydrochlorin ferrochelatase family protein [Priestia endophytica]|jgi:precorrin-2 dehydrogenase / sirohydrochlorin ferrochelatase|uniref:precorrin-2 dehydrogenase/sirohydrochlorin ferrochelatase family protein n=1 Tax=Priestia endophytica TaxID=135735 RepID=UPI000F526DBE|nr:NAD(P)-dependent oxidoreductase [Priestia endophytica]MED4071130.1 NAD(P)-dependent oxidoreductase [Priestia endophytica]RPK08680.1 Siroheme synthase [Priestia endophytica]
MYTVTLNIRNKKALVVGGGTVATRKIRHLLKEGANVTVISPEATDEIKKWKEEGEVHWEKREANELDVPSAFLVILATNNTEDNEKLLKAASPNQLVNVAHKGDKGSYTVPAQFTRGDLTISVSTGGGSPLLAKKIRNELSARYDESYEQYVNFLNEVRSFIHENEKQAEEKRKLLHSSLQEEMKDAHHQQLFWQALYDKYKKD